MTEAQVLARQANRFSGEKAREAGRRSQAVQAQKRAERAEHLARVDAILDTFDGEHLGPTTLAAALVLAKAAVRGEIPIPANATERKKLAEAAEILHRIGRLELGESTSNTHTVSETAQDVAARLSDARSRLAMLDTTVLDV